MKKLLLGLVGALGTIVLAGAGTAQAQIPDLIVPIDTVLTGQSLGNEVLVASETVPAGLVGQTCDVQAVAVNQASVHPDNDLIIRTGTSEVDILDVERGTDIVTPATGQVTFGPVVDVYVRMGPSTVFSAGMDVHFFCTPPPTTPPPTTAPPTTQPTSSTTASTVPGTPNPTTTAGRTSSGGTSSLPVTGDDSSRTVMVSLILLAGGTMLVLFARRRMS